MESILFSVDTTMVKIDDVIRHLSDHKELYWEVGFRINPNRFTYPIQGYMHISGGQVKYVATIKNIIPFSSAHYEDKELANKVKPAIWIKEWRDNVDNCQNYPWRNALIMTQIKPFSRDTLSFKIHDGRPVTHPPNSYIKVLKPEESTK